MTVAAFSIRDPEVHALARQLAACTAETRTVAVRRAPAERPERTGAPSAGESERRRRRILETAAGFRRKLAHDPRPDDGIVGCNADGHFG